MIRHDDDMHDRSSVRLLAAAVLLTLLICITLWAMGIATLHFAGALALPAWVLGTLMLEVVLAVVGFGALAIQFAFGRSTGPGRSRPRKR